MKRSLLLPMALLLFFGFSAVSSADTKKAAEAFLHRDYQESYKQLIPDAENGDPGAQWGLGLLYGMGRGVPQNNQTSFYWYKKAAEQGFPPAEADVGFAYALGRGVEKNEGLAAQWMMKAAVHGEARGQIALALMFHSGQGVQQDHDKEFYWTQRSANQGNSTAQFFLAGDYIMGNGTEPDIKKSYFWLILAKSKMSDDDQNFETTLSTIKTLEQNLSPSDIALIQSQAQLWTEKEESP
jgi:TPR repeat protein